MINVFNNIILDYSTNYYELYNENITGKPAISNTYFAYWYISQRLQSNVILLGLHSA